MVGEMTAPGMHIMCQSSTPQDIADFVVSAATAASMKCLVVVSSFRSHEILQEIYSRISERSGGHEHTRRFLLENGSSIRMARAEPECLTGAVYDLIVVDGLVSEQMQKECELRLLRQTLSPHAFYMTA